MSEKIRLNYKQIIVKNEGVLEGIFKNVPSNSGCYAFFSASLACLYVGQSINIRDRVRFGHRYTSKYMEAKFLYCWESYDRIALERYLIRYFQPIYNKKK